MSKARDLANAGTALTTVSATELGYVDGVTSAIQTQIDGKEATLPSQTGNSGKYLTTNGTDKSWGTVSQYALPSQTGNSGKFLTTNGTAESWGTVTTPLIWTERLNGVGYDMRTIAYNGSNLYVAAGDNGVLYTSSDAKTWTSRTSQFGSSNILKVAYGNGLWVAVGGAGKISTSTDGTTWTARTSNFASLDIRDVTYANSLWVAVGGGGGTTNTGGITYSTDGITWTRKSQSLTVGTTYYTVIWNGTNWIVGTNQQTNNFLYASTPSGTWTTGLVVSGLLSSITWDGTRHTIFSDNGNVYVTTSTTLSSPTSLSEIGSFDSNTNNNKVVLYDGKIYAKTGTYLFSFTPASNAYVSNYRIEGISPAARAQSGTPYLSDNTGGIFYGAAGWIVATNGAGRIYTSF